MELLRKTIAALELSQGEQALSALQVSDGDAFKYGRAAGIHQGLQMAIETANTILSEDEDRREAL